MNEADTKLVSEFLKSIKLDILNTRAFKKADNHFVITVGSISTEGSSTGSEFQGNKFDIEYGEFSEYLTEVIEHLKRAIPYAANDNQKEMIEHYITSYETGSIDTHKESQRKWIKD